MFRFTCLLLVFASFIACKKNNSPTHPITQDSVPAKVVDSNVALMVSMDTSVGAVIPSHSPDTLLIRLKDPNTMGAVPLVYHFAATAKINSGTPGKDSLWRDTVNLLNNAIKGLTVTAKNGKTANYFIAFQYFIDNKQFPWTAFRLQWKGDTLYAATASGLFLSVDDGKSFTSVASLGSDPIVGFYAYGSTIYAGQLDHMAISIDDGKTFSAVEFGPPTGGVGIFAAVADIAVQHDTAYVATYNGVRVTRNGWVNYDSAINDFLLNGTNFTQVSAIAVSGSTVYAGTRQALYTSSDGGKTFSVNNNLKSPNGNSIIQCNSLVIQNGVLHVGTNGWVFRSTDGGKSFTQPVFSDVYGKPVNSMCASDSMVAVASSYGLAISYDTGKTYTTYLGQSGVGGGTLNNAFSVAVKGKTIYSQFYNNYLTILRPRF